MRPALRTAGRALDEHQLGWLGLQRQFDAGRLALIGKRVWGCSGDCLSLGDSVFPVQLAVSTGDLNTRIDQWIRLTSVRAETSAAQEAPVGSTA